MSRSKKLQTCTSITMLKMVLEPKAQNGNRGRSAHYSSLFRYSQKYLNKTTLHQEWVREFLNKNLKRELKCADLPLFHVQTADWSWVFSHRMRISHCEKVTLLFFGLRSIFPNFRTVNKHINQSRWLCGADAMSISHNNINNNGWQALTCVSKHQVMFNKRRTNSKDNNLEDI